MVSIIHIYATALHTIIFMYFQFIYDMKFNISDKFENTPRGVNRCMVNLMTNNAKFKTNSNTLSVTKESSRIPGEGLWTNSSKFL